MLVLGRTRGQTVTIRVPPEAVENGEATIVVSVERLNEVNCRLGFKADKRISFTRDDCIRDRKHVGR